MKIELYHNSSDNNVIHKSLSGKLELTGTLRDSTDIRKPQILVELDDGSYNYAYIPEFSRYYYITDWTHVRNHAMIATMSSDVLMSFPVGNLTGILESSEDKGNLYLPSPVFSSLVKDKTRILRFGHGLSNTGNYILITAGG